MQFKYFLGIDISKSKLDVCLFDSKQILSEFIISNNATDLFRLFKKLGKISSEIKPENTIVCLEHTGVYNKHIYRQAVFEAWKLVVEPANQIKKSIGIQRGKNDRIDAYRIAKYAYKNREEIRFWEPVSKSLEQIKVLKTQRSALMKCKTALTQSCSEDKNFETKEIQKIKAKNLRGPIKELEKSIKKVEKQINQIIQEDPELKRLDKIITSVKGVGRENSINFLVCTNAFKTIDNPRKYACYGGVAPFQYSSGSSLKGKPRVSKQANMDVKAKLQMAAINACRWDKGLKDYYERKIKSGKHKMSVLNAIRNKIIHRVFACVRDNRMYDQNEISYT